MDVTAKQFTELLTLTEHLVANTDQMITLLKLILQALTPSAIPTEEQARAGLTRTA